MLAASQLKLFHTIDTARLFPWPGFETVVDQYPPLEMDTAPMTTDHLLLSLLEHVQAQREALPRGPIARNYAVLATDLERAYAYYLTYVYPHEADIPPTEELE